MQPTKSYAINNSILYGKVWAWEICFAIIPLFVCFTLAETGIFLLVRNTLLKRSRMRGLWKHQCRNSWDSGCCQSQSIMSSFSHKITSIIYHFCVKKLAIVMLLASIGTSIMNYSICCELKCVHETNLVLVFLHLNLNSYIFTYLTNKTIHFSAYLFLCSK